MPSPDSEVKAGPPIVPASPRELRMELAPTDLIMVRWLIELSWSSGAVKDTQQARQLVGLSLRIETLLVELKAQAGPGRKE